MGRLHRRAYALCGLAALFYAAIACAREQGLHLPMLEIGTPLK